MYNLYQINHIKFKNIYQENNRYASNPNYAFNTADEHISTMHSRIDRKKNDPLLLLIDSLFQLWILSVLIWYFNY